MLEKERVGDFEIDLVIGKDHKGALLTANDRATGIAKIKKIDSKDSQIVKEAIIELLSEFKSVLQTITSDNGKEFSQHQVYLVFHLVQKVNGRNIYASVLSCNLNSLTQFLELLHSQVQDC